MRTWALPGARVVQQEVMLEMRGWRCTAQVLRGADGCL